MSGPDFLADLRALDALTPKDDARRRTIVARAYHTAFLAATDPDMGDHPTPEIRRGALHKQLLELIVATGDPAMIRVARRLASLHAWRLHADYVLEMPIPPGQESACVDAAAEVQSVLAGRRRRRGIFDHLDDTLTDLFLCAIDIGDGDARLPLFRQLVGIHLARGNVDDAREAAGRMGDIDDEGRAAQSAVLAEIAAFQRSAGEETSARRTLAEAVRLAHSVPEDEDDLPGYIFRDMVDGLIDAGAVDLAVEVAEEIGDDASRDKTLALIVEAEVSSGRPEAARSAIDRITDPERRQAATAPLLVDRARAGAVAEALAAASALAGADGRVSTLATIAAVLAEAGRTTESLDLVSRIYDEQAAMDDPTERLEAVATGLAAQIKAGDAGGAEEAAATLREDLVTGWAFRRMTGAYVEIGDYDAAMESAARVDSDFFRGWAYETIGWGAAEAGEFEIARKAAACIDSPSRRLRARVRIAECEAVAGERRAANLTLDEALSEIGDDEDVEDRYGQSEAVAHAIVAVRDSAAVERAITAALAAADASATSKPKAVHLLDAAWLMVTADPAAP